MINNKIQAELDRWHQNYMVPANRVATVNVDNLLSHAFLVLTTDKFAKIVVVDNRNHYRGQLSLAMINDQLMETTKFNFQKLDQLTVADAMNTTAPVSHDPDDFEGNYQLLLNQSFVPVVADDGVFCGIVTRRKLMEALDFVMHDNHPGIQ